MNQFCENLLHAGLNLMHVMNDTLWEYVDFYIILAIGLYLTFKSNFFQIRTIIRPRETFRHLKRISEDDRINGGIRPLRLYFSSMGGSIGIGNIGGIVSAVSIGGPGGLFWMWVAVFVGMLVKYAEIFLGIKYRVKNKSGGYDGGAMYYLSHAFNSKTIPAFFCILMCIYGTEIYQFKVVEDAFVETFGLNRIAVVACLLGLTTYVTVGGVKRLSSVCTVLMPIFLALYTFVCVYVIIRSNVNFGELFSDVLKSAFSGRAAVGGFVGSSFMTTVQQGMSNAIYSGDIGMGYDSVIQSETQISEPGIQARTAMFSLFTDCTICTLSVLLVLCTNQWSAGYTHGFDFVVAALSPYVPGVKQLMAVFFALAGLTTIFGYQAVATKSAKTLSPKGPSIYLIYSIAAFIAFSFLDQNFAREIMFIAGGLIVLVNLIGIFVLRKEIQFSRHV
ncbi:MAG: amino acid carrier protein [Holosporales bacterium]|jgi:AGCS family alanine or glycine:cation symporter|nr:amino acid carrier protein [Holosporales bacterium]